MSDMRHARWTNDEHKCSLVEVVPGVRMSMGHVASSIGTVVECQQGKRNPTKHHSG